MSDGESAILQWIVNEGQVLESGDLKTAFLSGDPDSSHTGSDALYIDPPSDLKRWLNLTPEDVLRLRKMQSMASSMHHFGGIRGPAEPFDKLVLCRCNWTRVFGFSLRPVL